MWQTQREQFANYHQFRIFVDSEPVSYADVIRLWQDDLEFRLWFNALLVDSPYSAFRWETPSVSDTTVNRPFEFVLIDSPGLARAPDENAFSTYFRSATESGVVVFPNLGKNAVLVVPSPQTLTSAYGHLAAFVRQAPEDQIHELWKAVGMAMEERIGFRPVWLSTAGAGVSWLHVRLDDRPKYYHHQPYRTLG